MRGIGYPHIKLESFYYNSKWDAYKTPTGIKGRHDQSADIVKRPTYIGQQPKGKTNARSTHTCQF